MSAAAPAPVVIRRPKEKKDKTPEELLCQYFTPAWLAERMVEWANLRRGHRVLEPSAGDGALARAVPANVELTSYEIDATLPWKSEHPRPVACDFLRAAPPAKPFDVVVMNPPFNVAGEHVARALAVSSRVVALVPLLFLAGQARKRRIWDHAYLSRLVVLSARPKFWGPADKGEGIGIDMAIFELEPAPDREPGEIDQPRVEWWEAPAL